MDLTEPENRKEISYGTSRFQGSDVEGPELIRMFDGHCLPTRTPRADPDLDREYLAHDYCSEHGDNCEY